MSTTVDQRVVEMRFDNKHFESNVAQTMSTLEKLKQKLNLSKAAKGLDNLNAAAKNVNMTGLGTAVDTVSAKFSALQVMGVTALANITNSAVNAGKSIIRSLTIDPVKSGFSEYETKMGSIQTILANTEHQGTTLDDVTAALEELNLYADKTIYNFQEMTRNIGTFTAAGVDLDTSVRSIQGIANLAAVSGSTSQQASTAMYQLSQALATGTVKLMDWNSVVNAGMGGKVFQNALIQTAAVMAGAAEDVEAWQAENIDAYGSFRDSLTQGEWLTSEVLTRTLEQFTMAAEEGSAEWDAFKKELMDTGYTEAQAEGILKMANTATDAATKVKTFTQLMDTLKESAQSGWAQTWELFVGDFEEAKAFFTELSDLFGGIIGDSANRRNTFFSGALTSNWDKLIGKINEAGIKTEEFEESIRKVVGDDKLDGLIDDYGSLEEAVRKGAVSSDVLKKALDGIGGTDADSKIEGFVEGLKEIERTLQRGHVGEDVKKLQTALKGLGYDLGEPDIDGIIGPITENAIKAFQEANGIIADGIAGPETIAALEKAGSKVGEVTGEVDDLKLSCDELIDEITKKSGRELLLESLMNIIKAIHRPLSALGEAFRNTFSISSDQLYNGLKGLNKFTSSFVMRGVLDETTWAGLIDRVNELGISTTEFELKLKETLANNGVDVDKLIEKYGDLGNAFKEGAISIDTIKEALLGFEGITETLLLGGETADKLRRSFEGLFAIFSIFTNTIGGGFKIAFKVISALLGKFDMGILDFTAMLGDTLVGISDFINGIIDSGIDAFLDWLVPKIESAALAVGAWIDAFKETELGRTIVDAIENWPATLEKIGDAFDNCVTTVKGWIDEFMALPIVQDILTRLGRVAQNVTKRVKDFFSGGLDRIREFIDYVKSFDNITLDDLGLIFQNFKDNVLSYFADGAIKAFGRIRSALGNFKDYISKQLEKAGGAFDTLWGKISAFVQFVKEKFNEHIGIGGLIAAVLGIGLVFALKKLGDVLELVTTPFELLDTIKTGVGKVLNSLSLALKAFALNIAAGALIKIAIAIAILAAALTVLSTVNWKGVLASSLILLGLVGALAAIAVIMSKVDKISIDVGAKMNGVVLAILAIAAAVFILSQAMKTLDGLNPDRMGVNLLYVVALAAMLATVAGVMGKYVPEMTKGSVFLIAMAGAVWILADAMLRLNELSLDGIEDKLGLMIFLMGGLALIAVASKGIGAGSALSILGAVIALKLLIGMIDDIAGIDVKMVEDNIWSFIGIFGAFALLMVTSHLAGEHAAKAGVGILAMSVALLVIIRAIKLLGEIPIDTLTQGGIAVAALMALFAGIVAVSYFAGQHAAKAGVMLLAMSAAILILTIAIFALSKLDPDGLYNAMDAITILGGVFAGLIAVTSLAKETKGTIIALSIAVAVLAAAIAVLSLLNPNGLWNAVGAISVLMIIFGGLIFVTKYAQKAIGTIIVITGVVVVLAGILYALQGLPVESTLVNVVAIGGLLVAMTVVLKILSGITHIAAGALISLGVMLIIVAGIAAIFWAMDALNIEASISTAVALSTLLLSMSAACLILAGVGTFAGAALTGAATMAGIVAGVAIFLAALGALVTYFPDIELWVNKGLGLLDTLCSGIGKALGSLVDSFLVGATDDLYSVGENLSSFMEKLQPFLDGINGLDESFATKMEAVVKGIGVLAAAEWLGTITKLIPGGDTTLADFAAQLGVLGTGLNDFMTNAGGITPEAVTPIVDAAAKLAGIKPPRDGLFDNDGIDNFGKDLATFGTNIASFFAAFAEVTIDTTKVGTIVDAANQLGSIVVPKDGLFDTDGIDNFGKDLETFATGLAGFFSVFSEVTIDSAKVTTVVDVANKLASIDIPEDGFFNGDGIDNFGADIYNFGVKLRDYSIVASEINSDGVSKATTAMTDIVSSVQSMVGLDTSGITTFKSAIEELGTITIDNVANVFDGAADSFRGAGSRLVDSITSGIKSARTDLTNTANTMVTTVSKAIKDKASEFNSAGKEIAAKFAKGILDKKSAAKTAGTTVGAQAVSGAESKYDGMVGAGEYLGDGLVEGIEGKVQDAYDAGFKLGAAAVQGEKDGQQSNSPSKATIQAGKWLGEGLIVGMQRMGRAVNKAGFGMGEGAVNSLSNTISNISDVINSDIDAQPTIRPVLDLGDVRTGAAAISSMLGGESAFGLTANARVVGAMMNQRRQNGDSEVVSAIDKLRRDIGNMNTTTYSINGITYDGSSDIATAIETIARRARMDRRV